MKKLKKKRNDTLLSPKVKKVVKSFVDNDSFSVDPNGSWTGHPADEKEKPIQDADDL